MNKFFFVIGWPFRVFVASVVFVVGNMVEPYDYKYNTQLAKDIYHGREHKL